MSRPDAEIRADARASIAAVAGLIDCPPWRVRASPGPWHVEVTPGVVQDQTAVVDDRGRQVVRLLVRHGSNECEEQFFCTVGAREYEEANAVHIATMRDREPRLAQDAIDLMAEVCQLLEVLRAARVFVDHARDEKVLRLVDAALRRRDP